LIHETNAAFTMPCGTDGSMRQHHAPSIANCA
jgi:hypothetical protein